MADIFQSAWLFVVLATIGSQSIAADLNVMSWGIIPSDHNPAFISQARLGCPPSPVYCTNKLIAYRNTKIQKASLAIHWKTIPANILTKHVAAHIELIAKETIVDVELSIDDFGSFAKTFGNELANEVITLLKSNKTSTVRPHTVGITLYEDELATIASNQNLIQALTKVDRIALFLHYRASQQNLVSHLNFLKQLAPSSKIYLGIYHYDRSDYISCTKESFKKCTEAQEEFLFRRALEAQLLLLESNQIDGLELYPGYFGNEQKWTGWSNHRICHPRRIDNCIENSRKMSALVLQKLTNLYKHNKTQ